jgi:hypothetical protein
LKGKPDHIICLTELHFYLCSTKFHFPTDENTSGERKQNGTWTGVFGMFQRDEVAITNLVFAMMSKRLEIVDYSFPTLENR